MTMMTEKQNDLSSVATLANIGDKKVLGLLPRDEENNRIIVSTSFRLAFDIPTEPGCFLFLPTKTRFCIERGNVERGAAQRWSTTI